ncbi:radical SAM protein [Candidatus Woesearchaeota archaeon]|nr:radical SAM protein [Candidatus Woesearchaeota archaeon]
MKSKKEILLIYPPFCTPVSPPYSITSLSAFLRNNCKDNISVLDLNSFFHRTKYPEHWRFFRSIDNIKDLDRYKEASDRFLENTKQDYSRNNRNVLEGKKVDLFNECISEIRKKSPDIVAISLVYNSQTFYAKALIEELRKQGTKVVIGGPAATEKLECDGMLGNELDLLEFITGEKADHDNLDFHTIPDFSIYNMEDYFTPEIVYPLRTSYACYYGKCSFCTHHGNKSYMEIDLSHFEKAIIANKCRRVFIVDDMIFKKRLIEISKIMKKHKVEWLCQLRPTKDLDKETLRFLSDGGMRMVLWGLESANDRILKLMKKGTNVESAKKVLWDAHDEGIKNVTYVMFGFPTETREEFWNTRDFLEQNSGCIDLISTSVFGLQIGSEIYRNPKEYGIDRVDEQERTFLNPKITYDIQEGMTQKVAIKMQSNNQKRIYAVNKYPRMMNFFREHMLLACSRNLK